MEDTIKELRKIVKEQAEEIAKLKKELEESKSDPFKPYKDAMDEGQKNKRLYPKHPYPWGPRREDDY